MRFVLVCWLILGACEVASGEVKIFGETKYKPHSLVRLRADGVDAKAAIRWKVSPSKDVQKATTAKSVLEFAAHPGTYEVELLVIQTIDGNLQFEEQIVTVEIEGCKPLPPLPDPKTPDPKTPDMPKPNPLAALGKIRFGNAGCTATIIERRPDGRWDLLTAAHCTGPVGSRGTFYAKDGREFAVTVTARNTNSDLCWLESDDANIKDLPFAMVAKSSPVVGTKIWHAGYGYDKPGNREDGEVVANPDSNGQIMYLLSVSSGDSGGGIFNADTGEWLGAVCCTSSMAQKGRVWAGGPLAAKELRTKIQRSTSNRDEWVPLEIPVRKHDAEQQMEQRGWVPVPIPIRSIYLIETRGD